VLLAPWTDVGQRLADIVAEFSGLGFRGPFLGCDARIVHEAGGSEGQELGWALACAAAYMRALTERGVPLAQAERALGFTLAVDQDQFIGTAKLRALRRLMARVQAACGLAPGPIRIHAETAWRMMTRADTPVNMLRNATAVFAAAVGGADSIGVLPHTAALGLGDDFARRVARNTQHVLAEESHLWRVADPAAGAGSIEALTDALCERGWAAFQEIESEGGLVASLTGGRIQQRIAAIRARRERDITTGRAALTGTSAFPNLTEKAETALDLRPAAPASPKGGSACAPALPSTRLSEPFEQCRDRAVALAAEGKAATVFLAVLGPLQAAAPRIGFATGLLASGGIGAVQPGSFAEADGATDLVALTDAFKASGASMACLCGPDAAYDAEAVDAAMALAASGARGIWLAGRPGEREAALRAAGVTGFIYAGCDMIAALKEAFDVIAA
jgi:methylmalonyl-CoA mutase